MCTDDEDGHPLESVVFKSPDALAGLPSAANVSLRVSHETVADAETPLEHYWRQVREVRAAGGFLEHEFPRQNVWLVAQRHFEDEMTAREFIRQVKHRFGGQQRRDGYPRWHFEVLEGTTGVHNNLVGPLSMERAEQLLGYTFEGVAFGQFITVQQVTALRGGMRGLIGFGLKPGYLTKELGQKHALGALGGDKVRFSEAFRLELVERDLITGRSQGYRSRRALPSTGHTDDAEAVTAFGKVVPAVAASTAPRDAVAPSAPVLRVVVDNALTPGELQLSLLPEKPVTRLRDFAHGILPPAVAHEIETRRKWLGLTQEEVADAIGISRPQLTNALNEKFGLSEWVAARLRDFLLRGESLAA